MRRKIGCRPPCQWHRRSAPQRPRHGDSTERQARASAGFRVRAPAGRRTAASGSQRASAADAPQLGRPHLPHLVCCRRIRRASPRSRCIVPATPRLTGGTDHTPTQRTGILTFFRSKADFSRADKGVVAQPAAHARREAKSHQSTAKGRSGWRCSGPLSCRHPAQQLTEQKSDQH